MIIKDNQYHASIYRLARKHLETSIQMVDQAQASTGQYALDSLKGASTKLRAARRLLDSERNVLEDAVNSDKLRASEA